MAAVDLTTELFESCTFVWEMLKLTTIEDEFQRCPQLKTEYITMLRDWLKHQPHLPDIADDLTLAMFLRSCDYSIERTKITIDNYFSLRTHVPEMIVPRSTRDKGMQQCLDLVEMVLLEDTDPDGNVVMIERLRHADPSTYDAYATLRASLMLIEGRIREHGTVPGCILVFDQTFYGLSHLARISPMQAKRMLHFVQDCSHVAVRGIHVINANQLVDKIVMFFKPFMNAKLRSMLKIHREGSYEEFYKQVPQEILPKEYGGPKDDMQTLYSKSLKNAERYNGLFESIDKLVVDEAKRVGKVANADALFGVEGSFKKLDID